MKAALQIEQQLRLAKLEATIGIATGTTFCGIVGGYARHEYAVVGPTVNLAARLMVSYLRSVFLSLLLCGV